MRRGFLFFSVGLLSFLSIGVYVTFNLLTLLVDSEGRDAILRSELPVSKTDRLSVEEDHLIVPKIIHQTYKNASIPQRWQEAHQSCIDLHPDYEHYLWTDETARQFLVDEYPWFVDTWDAYPFPIQRADVIRYFILYHYGGIYIDLDNGCKRRLDPLLKYPSFLRRTTPTGISNDLMGSISGHKFFLKTMTSLKSFKRSWILPYITIMSTTGPLFLSVIWKKYNRHRSADEMDRVRLLLSEEATFRDWSFFVPYVGSSWHGSDAKFLLYLGDHIVMITLGITLAVLCLLYVLYQVLARVGSSGSIWRKTRSLRGRGRHAGNKNWQGSPRGGYRKDSTDRHEV